jgi:hypothetical protein
MNHGNPQSNGRSNFRGPKLGILEKTFLTPEVSAGIVIGTDSTIYCVSSSFSHGGLYAYLQNGTLKWYIPSVYSMTTPLIGTDGTIYFVCGIKIYAVNPDGSIKWEYPFEFGSNVIMHGINIGLDGTIYYIDLNNKFNALDKYGNLKWFIQDNRFYVGNTNALVFSPDGKTIYCRGINDAILAVDIENKAINWVFGKIREGIEAAPIVDSYGNIYTYCVIDTMNTLKSAFVSLNRSGNIRWSFEINTCLHTQPTIDKQGNIYFACDTLYSLDFWGNLRWKVPLGVNLYQGSSLVCDIDGTVYLCIDNITLTIMAVDKQGSIIWTLNDPSYGVVSISPALCFGKLYIPTSNWYNFYSVK